MGANSPRPRLLRPRRPCPRHRHRHQPLRSAAIRLRATRQLSRAHSSLICPIAAAAALLQGGDVGAPEQAAADADGGSSRVDGRPHRDGQESDSESALSGERAAEQAHVHRRHVGRLRPRVAAGRRRPAGTWPRGVAARRAARRLDGRWQVRDRSNRRSRRSPTGGGDDVAASKRRAEPGVGDVGRPPRAGAPAARRAIRRVAARREDGAPSSQNRQQAAFAPRETASTTTSTSAPRGRTPPPALTRRLSTAPLAGRGDPPSAAARRRSRRPDRRPDGGRFRQRRPRLPTGRRPVRWRRGVRRGGALPLGAALAAGRDARLRRSLAPGPSGMPDPTQLAARQVVASLGADDLPPDMRETLMQGGVDGLPLPAPGHPPQQRQRGSRRAIRSFKARRTLTGCGRAWGSTALIRTKSRRASRWATNCRCRPCWRRRARTAPPRWAAVCRSAQLSGWRWGGCRAARHQSDLSSCTRRRRRRRASHRRATSRRCRWRRRRPRCCSSRATRRRRRRRPPRRRRRSKRLSNGRWRRRCRRRKRERTRTRRRTLGSTWERRAAAAAAAAAARRRGGRSGRSGRATKTSSSYGASGNSGASGVRLRRR